MNYSKYYTPAGMADLLVGLIDKKKPKTAIDICCGSYNLLYAAKRRWTGINLIGVDIIPHTAKNVLCINLDGREYAINQKQKYPLILANPPFSSKNNNEKFSMLYNGIFARYRTSRLENEMLLANLHLLDKDGLLVIILPSTFVESEKSSKMRILLANAYHVKKIIKLPNNTFGSTGIRSYALFISNKIMQRKITKYYEVISQGDNLNISQERTIDQRIIRKGHWLNHICKNISKIDIRRGNISSQMFCTEGFIVLHTAKRNNNWSPSIRYIMENPKNPVFTESGDILISRVGKSAGQWTIYNGEKALISDCLFSLRDSGGSIYEKIKDKEYNGNIRGVVTRYITKKDFLSWITTASR